MSSRSWIFLLCGALAASLAANVRLAWPSAVSRAGEPAAECVWLETLGLSDAQMARLRACCQSDCCDAGADFAAQAERVRRELRTALAEPQVDSPRVRALAAELGTIQSRCTTMAVDSILRVRDILDPAQMAKVLEQCRASDGP